APPVALPLEQGKSSIALLASMASAAQQPPDQPVEHPLELPPEPRTDPELEPPTEPQLLKIERRQQPLPQVKPFKPAIAPDLLAEAPPPRIDKSPIEERVVAPSAQAPDSRRPPSLPPTISELVIVES